MTDKKTESLPQGSPTLSEALDTIEYMRKERVRAEEREAALREEVEALKKATNFSDAVACVFDMLKYAAANTSCKEWDSQLEDLAQDVIEFAPEYKKQWKDIGALQQRLTVAEQRAGELKKLLCDVINEAPTGFAALKVDLAHRVNDALKPATEG